jgi:hypothetical protein
MNTKRYFTLDELVLLLLLILVGLLWRFGIVASIHLSACMLMGGMIGALLCSCVARIRIRHCHPAEYSRLNGATLIAPLNRPENRQMLGFMWTFSFLKSGDWMLTILLITALLFQVCGYIGIALGFLIRQHH